MKLPLVKLTIAFFALCITCTYSCQKEDQSIKEQEEETITNPPQTENSEIGTKIKIDKDYLTDTTKAIDENYKKFAGVWKLNLFVCGTCGVYPQVTDTTEILTLRQNGQYEILRKDTVYYTGNYKIQYNNRCGFEAFEKTFLFEDVKSSERLTNAEIPLPVEWFSQTIEISNNSLLRIAASRCAVDMDGYRTYMRVTE